MSKYVHVGEVAEAWAEAVRRGAAREALKRYAEELRYRRMINLECAICGASLESPLWYRMAVYMVPLCRRCCDGVEALARRQE